MRTIYVHKACVERFKQMVATSDLFTKTNRPTQNTEFQAVNNKMMCADYICSPKSCEILEAYARGLSDVMNYVLPELMKGIL